MRISFQNLKKNINFFKSINFTKNFYSFPISRTFCSLNRLNMDKLKLEKLDEKDIQLALLKKKEESPKFNKEDHIVEFGPGFKWEEVVLKSEIPVVVDCYASWCSPCKKLMPILEKKLEEGKNFKLVKIDIDANGELAEMLSISSVPTIFLVYKGNVIDSFVGLPDSKKLEQFFESIGLIFGIGQDSKIILALLTGADEYMDKKIYDRAENMLNEAYSHQIWREKFGHVIKLGLALCAFNRSDYSIAEKICKELRSTKNYKDLIAADSVLSKKLALLEMKLTFKNNPELITKESDNLEKEIESNPKDLNIRYKLAVHFFDNAYYEQAIDTLLEIIAIDRNWNNKAANQFLIQIFNFLGSDNKLTTAGRAKLTKLLY